MIGNKAKNLDFLKDKFPSKVPEFITVNLEDLVNKESINKLASVYESSVKRSSSHEREAEITEVINNTKLNQVAVKKITTALEEKQMDTNLLAFRVSTNVEDKENYSFAGMFETFLNIELEPSQKSGSNKLNKEIERILKKCWKSIYSTRVLEYCKSVELNPKSIKASIVVQNMFHGDYYGVAFVKTNCLARLSFSKIIKATVDGEESIELDIDLGNPDYRSLPKDIPEETWLELFESFKQIITIKGRNQDIEWGINTETFGLLQTRDITRDIKIEIPIYKVTLDKSNIAENYSGITVPLTYSFIKEAYENVYQHFLRLVGIKNSKIKKNIYIFENMLGYYNGQIFYNINNWYEMLKLLPGYDLNKELFEIMLNPVKKKSQTKFSTFSILKNNLYVILNFSWKIFRIKKIYYLFESKYEQLINDNEKIDKQKLTNFNLVNTHKTIEDKFFALWGYTIINDFRLMIFNGLLNKFLDKKTSNKDRIIGEILNNAGNLYSIKPMQEIEKLAQYIQHYDNKFADLLKSNKFPEAELYVTDNKHPKLNKKINAYITKYGFRFGSELKLENISMQEDINILFKILSNHLNIQSQSVNHHKKVNVKPDLGFINLRIFNYLKTQTILSMHKREQYRFYRARVFRIARSYFMEFADRFLQVGIIKHRDDIFYLSKEEVFDIARSHSSPHIVNKLISTRKKEFMNYEGQELARAIDIHWYQNEIKVVEHDEPHSKHLTGQVVSYGSSLTGECVVMNQISTEVDIKGKILVTSKTDPGWTVLFPLAKAIICEYGNSLSHAAIVSRELNKVCLVGVRNATTLIQTGDRLEINTETGKIKITN